MSHVLYEWEFANYLCRVVESEPGIVHFEQARNESGGDPRVMEFQRTATPMGAANEIIQLHRALAEAEMLNRDLAAFYQGYQEDRNRREQRIAQLEADLEAAREIVRAATFIGADGRPCWTGCYGVSPVPDSQAPAVRAAWEGK